MAEDGDARRYEVPLRLSKIPRDRITSSQIVSVEIVENAAEIFDFRTTALNQFSDCD